MTSPLEKQDQQGQQQQGEEKGIAGPLVIEAMEECNEEEGSVDSCGRINTRFYNDVTADEDGPSSGNDDHATPPPPVNDNYKECHVMLPAAAAAIADLSSNEINSRSINSNTSDNSNNATNDNDSVVDPTIEKLSRLAGVQVSPEWLAACRAHIRQSTLTTTAAASEDHDINEILHYILHSDLRQVVVVAATSNSTNNNTAAMSLRRAIAKSLQFQSHQNYNSISSNTNTDGSSIHDGKATWTTKDTNNNNNITSHGNNNNNPTLLMVQVEEALDVSQNAQDRLKYGPTSLTSSPTPVGGGKNQLRRCLKLAISDGYDNEDSSLGENENDNNTRNKMLVAMEVSPITNLSVNSLPGIKLLLSSNSNASSTNTNLTIRLGVLMLHNGNTTVLGGSISDLKPIQQKAVEMAKRIAGVGIDPTIRALVWNTTQQGVLGNEGDMGEEEDGEGGGREGESQDVVAAPAAPLAPLGLAGTASGVVGRNQEQVDRVEIPLLPIVQLPQQPQPRQQFNNNHLNTSFTSATAIATGQPLTNPYSSWTTPRHVINTSNNNISGSVSNTNINNNSNSSSHSTNKSSNTNNKDSRQTTLNFPVVTTAATSAAAPVSTLGARTSGSVVASSSRGSNASNSNSNTASTTATTTVAAVGLSTMITPRQNPYQNYFYSSTNSNTTFATNNNRLMSNNSNNNNPSSSITITATMSNLVSPMQQTSMVTMNTINNINDDNGTNNLTASTIPAAVTEPLSSSVTTPSMSCTAAEAEAVLTPVESMIPVSFDELRTIIQDCQCNASLYSGYEDKVFIVPSRLQQRSTTTLSSSSSSSLSKLNFNIVKKKKEDRMKSKYGGHSSSSKKNKGDDKYEYILICSWVGPIENGLSITANLSNNLLEPFFRMSPGALRKLSREDKSRSSAIVEEGGKAIVDEFSALSLFHIKFSMSSDDFFNSSSSSAADAAAATDGVAFTTDEPKRPIGGDHPIIIIIGKSD